MFERDLTELQNYFRINQAKLNWYTANLIYLVINKDQLF